MPVQTVRLSSLSGDLIPPGTGARVRIMFWDEGREDMRLDLTDAEVTDLAKRYKAEEVKPRPDRRVSKA